MSKITSYKGFDKNLKCRDFQYEIGGSYNHDGEVEKCGSGFHAYQTPFDVFTYYSPSFSRYAIVEQSGEIDKGDDKIASSKLKVVSELSLQDLIKLQIEFIESNLNENKKSNTGHRSAASNTGNYSAASSTGHQSTASNTGDYSAASNTGSQSAASNTGDYSAASNTGDRSAASNTGRYSAASNTGHQSAASNTGDYSAASNTGNYSAASNTGDYSAASNTGDYSAASNTGNYSAASVDGKDSVAVVTGRNSKAKASHGSWIVVTEKDGELDIINIKTGKAGRDIKADTYYTVVNNEFVEFEEDEN